MEDTIKGKYICAFNLMIINKKKHKIKRKTNDIYIPVEFLMIRTSRCSQSIFPIDVPWPLSHELWVFLLQNPYNKTLGQEHRIVLNILC